MTPCTATTAEHALVCSPPPRFGSGAKGQYSQGWLLCEMLLLGKAVLVAIYGLDDVFPDTRTGNVGLAFMFCCILCSALCVALETLLVTHFVTGRRDKARALTSEETPLLEKPDGVDEAAAQQASDARTILTLVAYSAQDTVLLSVAFAAGALAALALALIPYFTGQIVDYATIDQDSHAFTLTTGKLLAASLACAIFTGIRGGLFTVGITRLNVRLRTNLFASLLRQDMGYFDTAKSGEITSRLAADTTTVADQICLNINVLMRSLTQAVLVLIFMFHASWRLAVITFIMIPCALSISKVYGAYFRKLGKKVQAELAEANAVADEALGNVGTVRAHAAEDSVKAAYAAKLQLFYVLEMKTALAYCTYMVTATFLPNVVSAGVLFYGGHLVLANRMSAGALVSFMLYQQSLSGSFQSMGDVLSALSAAVGAADKVVELIHRQPATPAPGTYTPDTFAGRLQLSDVHFRYPARPDAPVLNGLSLQVNPGEVVALVGSSGGGKSSIVKLIQHFYMPSQGHVRFDGRDVGLYNPKWLRRRVAIVNQEPTLFARSIKRNILYGLEREDGVPAAEVPTQADVEHAAQLANIHHVILAMPQGYDSECGERGVQLSGGQKQRIAIARALVRRPAVLLLDEATSALDADSEAAVQDALDGIMKHHTVLVVAHRLSTIQNATRILVVSKGTVVEQGRHEDLIEAGGTYSALVRRQMQKSASTMSLTMRPDQGPGPSMFL
ncbi:hypothetical protein WJX73_000962 [Symbiochloris irregularis]|uniref:Uncharacterized protein n=1 Tax=Symbiochloris irregularis TaxID=706552 RepID=A0AAW1NPV1_9CHLO